jgi:hypothetical protein
MAKTTIVDDEVNKWRGFTEVMAALERTYRKAESTVEDKLSEYET